MTTLQVLREVAPTAQVDPTARIDRWCVIGPDVRIGPRTRLQRKVTVIGHAILGADNVVGEGSVLGADPQDLKYRGGRAWAIVGDRNRIGVNVTIHVGTEAGGRVTRVGNDSDLADGCHVAHDCFLADRVRLGRKVLLAGHVVLRTGAVIEDMTGVHHFTQVGQYARVGARTPVTRDVPPFVHYYSTDYYWDPPMVRGIHEEGIAAAALPHAEEVQLRWALAELFESEAALATMLDRVERLQPLHPATADLCRICRGSLAGLYGRYREQFRNQVPPEAREFLPDWLLAEVHKEMSCR
jgi:UDP-N-acetylglucosamine acyltransferase